MGQQLPHGSDVPDLGQAVELHWALRQKTGRQGGESGVLGTAGRDLPPEAIGSDDAKAIHDGLPGLYSLPLTRGRSQ